MIHLPPEFKEFLQLLNARGVEFLVVGGYAVGFHGYPRATGDMDVWVAFRPGNLRQVAAVLKDFGFTINEPVEDFLREGQFIGIGASPLRIEILTAISGVDFAECFAQRVETLVDGIAVPFISLHQLKANKQASARLKDLNDLENLPDTTS